MGLIIRRPQFVEDLRDVWDFIARGSERHADALVLELEKRYLTLSENPFPGVQRFPNYPGMRMFSFSQVHHHLRSFARLL
ncbi:type II toxin-antitoxin system RelE/ParE family toxin [Neorhizobium sp. DT-125]|uniref:type II toxin-antitoxin system RelE/ParE family toxin n=1 Tax=Neorhizobium sp. DT-125 TaxID=3396163 RepID=UPI003F1C6BD8